MNDYRWADLTVGQTASFEVVVTAGMVDTFAALSGDLNPLHLDDEFARNAGFAGRVVFGMLSAAFYSRLVGMYLPGKRALLHGVDANFNSPALIDDRLTVSGEIYYLNDAYKRIEMRARIIKQDGSLISKAKLRASLHES